jgi:hypothetical protein
MIYTLGIVILILFLWKMKSEHDKSNDKFTPIKEFKVHNEYIDMALNFRDSISGLCRRYGFEDTLILAQCCVESGVGKWNVGDSGKSLGIMQIQKEAWNEGTKYLGLQYKFEFDALDNIKNVHVAIGYHLVNSERMKSKDGSLLIRAYNAGINGVNSQQAKEYEKKVWAYYHAIRDRLSP